MSLARTFLIKKILRLRISRTGVPILAILLLVGCSRQGPELDREQSGEISNVVGWRERIQKVDDLFELRAVREEYITEKTEPAGEVLVALESRRDQLVEEREAFPAIPGALDFLGWDIKWLGPEPDRPADDDRERYRIAGYFVVTGDMARDWIFRIMTKVDDHHISYLPPDRRKAKYLNWQIPAETSTWLPGEHHILSTVIELRPIPYYIYARMYYYPEMINHADFAYGWFADPDVGKIEKDRSAPR